MCFHFPIDLLIRVLFVPPLAVRFRVDKEREEWVFLFFVVGTHLDVDGRAKSLINSIVVERRTFTVRNCVQVGQTNSCVEIV